MTFAEATRREGCALVDGRNEAFVVDWPADKRSDLEVALKQRIPVVAYDCSQLRLLDDCELDGTYRFVGVTEKEEVIRLEDSEEVKANLLFSGKGIAGKLGADLERGSTIDIAFAIIGKRTSTKARVARGQLRGECAGATHFVRAMTLGAFAMQVGTRAKVEAAASILTAVNVGGTSSSSRDATSREGDLAACKTSTPDAEEPVAQCGAPIRIELRSIYDDLPAAGTDASAEAGAPTARGVDPRASDAVPVVCPTGLVATDEGKCTHASPNAPHLCTPHDAADCEIQCTRGSATSCALFARMLQLGVDAPKDSERARRLFERACTGGSVQGCGRLGEVLLGEHREADGRNLLKRSCEAGWVTACDLLGRYLTMTGQAQKTDAFTLFKRACDGGDAEGCWSLGFLFREGVGVRQNDGDAIRNFQLACDGGAKLGCADYAKMLDAGRGAPADTARAVKLLEASCDRGYSGSCDTLALWCFMGHGVAKDPARGIALLQRACDGTTLTACVVLGERYEFGIDVAKDPQRAAPLYDRACSSGIEIGCKAAIHLRTTAP
jgi:TPR repeat protein